MSDLAFYVVGLLAGLGGLFAIFTAGKRSERQKEDLHDARDAIEVRRRVDAAHGADDPDIARERLRKRSKG